MAQMAYKHKQKANQMQPISGGIYYLHYCNVRESYKRIWILLYQTL